MAQPTSVDLPGLQAAINTFSTSLAGFDGQYNAMGTQIADIAGKWTGQAYQSFEQALNNWLSDFNRVLKVLNGMENALSQNTSVLTQTNENTIAAAQKAASMMTTPPLPGF